MRVRTHPFAILADFLFQVKIAVLCRQIDRLIGIIHQVGQSNTEAIIRPCTIYHLGKTATPPTQRILKIYENGNPTFFK